MPKRSSSPADAGNAKRRKARRLVSSRNKSCTTCLRMLANERSLDRLCQQDTNSKSKKCVYCCDTKKAGKDGQCTFAAGKVASASGVALVDAALELAEVREAQRDPAASLITRSEYGWASEFTAPKFPSGDATFVTWKAWLAKYEAKAHDTFVDACEAYKKSLENEDGGGGGGPSDELPAGLRDEHDSPDEDPAGLRYEYNSSDITEAQRDKTMGDIGTGVSLGLTALYRLSRGEVPLIPADDEAQFAAHVRHMGSLRSLLLYDKLASNAQDYLDRVRAAKDRRR
ncbi:hypothetical protein GGTG_07728 [Gaeumannomyces tritici R3-111a-1]|uniref:Uncharacterized protein n=1 Tax=Gaeumannomyces tritici (strain R3-111a-1) TaxID=644352 RepID=J3P2I2_GAET3|nr:hypothetical protein GGTG_07728 [Gaeumannomyces tritici R3-111a-1]EJT73874.1 hypothetical protein GGTG_07728 [Gaeumannomyces tritici R3-111a-1]